MIMVWLYSWMLGSPILLTLIIFLVGLGRLLTLIRTLALLLELSLLSFSSLRTFSCLAIYLLTLTKIIQINPRTTITVGCKDLFYLLITSNRSKLSNNNIRTIFNNNNNNNMKIVMMILRQLISISTDIRE